MYNPNKTSKTKKRPRLLQKKEIHSQPTAEPRPQREPSSRKNKIKIPKIFIAIQGGGAKGGWQGGVINSLMNVATIDGVIGSSAGAINSAIVSIKSEDNTKNPFKSFWLRASWITFSIVTILIAAILVASFNLSLLKVLEFFKKHAFAILLLLIGIFLMALFSLVFKNRLPSLFSTNSYALFLKLLLGKNEITAEFLTYIHITDTQTENRPNFRDQLFQRPLAFYPEKQSACLNGALVSLIDAIAISGSLPLLFNPKEIQGISYADGGLYSNLPLQLILDNKSVHCDYVVCICATRIQDLNASDYIDWMTLRLLTDLITEQKESRFPSNTTPVILIEPNERLKSKTVVGFFRPWLMKKEIQLGEQKGQELTPLLRSFGDNDTLQPYYLHERQLPELPIRPKVPWWKYWVNRKWI